jgi:hypothetical protein
MAAFGRTVLQLVKDGKCAAAGIHMKSTIRIKFCLQNIRKNGKPG